MMGNFAHNAGSFLVGTQSQLAKGSSWSDVPQCRTATFRQVVATLPLSVFLLVFLQRGGENKGTGAEKRHLVATTLWGAHLGRSLRKLCWLRLERKGRKGRPQQVPAWLSAACSCTSTWSPAGQR